MSCYLPPPCTEKQTQTDLTSSDIEKMQLYAAKKIILDDRSEASDSDVSSAWGPLNQMGNLCPVNPQTIVTHIISSRKENILSLNLSHTVIHIMYSVPQGQPPLGRAYDATKSALGRMSVHREIFCLCKSSE